jgi:hypothetical protein
VINEDYPLFRPRTTVVRFLLEAINIRADFFEFSSIHILSAGYVRHIATKKGLAGKG